MADRSPSSMAPSIVASRAVSRNKPSTSDCIAVNSSDDSTWRTFEIMASRFGRDATCSVVFIALQILAQPGAGGPNPGENQNILPTNNRCISQGKVRSCHRCRPLLPDAAGNAASLSVSGFSIFEALGTFPWRGSDERK